MVRVAAQAEDLVHRMLNEMGVGESNREGRRKEEGKKCVGETSDALSHGWRRSGVPPLLCLYSFRPCEVLKPESWHKQLHRPQSTVARALFCCLLALGPGQRTL